jgi:perosamine synthetase
LKTIIPVNEPLLGREELRQVTACIRSSWISSQGKFLTDFEEAFAAYCGVKFGISTSSGTTALHLALAALDIGPGDEVLIPTFTMAATAFAVCYCGATPVFIDSEPDTFNIDPEQIRGYLRLQEKRGRLKVKAILPVHLYGHPADMEALREIADRYALFLVEDAAEAHGAEYQGKRCGGFGQFGCFSFYANKIITTGEGGMVVTDDPELARKARRLKDLAHSEQKRFLHTDLGFNYRMTNLQAAIGLAQLKKIERHIRKKRWMARAYTQVLQGLPGLRLPLEKPWARNVYWMYGILIEESFGRSRDQVMAALKKQGVDTRSFFFSMHQQPVFKDRRVKSRRFGRYPVAERLSEQGFYLPSGLTISRDQIRYIGEQMRRLAG